MALHPLATRTTWGLANAIIYATCIRNRIKHTLLRYCHTLSTNHTPQPWCVHSSSEHPGDAGHKRVCRSLSCAERPMVTREDALGCVGMGCSAEGYPAPPPVPDEHNDHLDLLRRYMPEKKKEARTHQHQRRCMCTF
jgi:hypothetical protein